MAPHLFIAYRLRFLGSAGSALFFSQEVAWQPQAEIRLWRNQHVNTGRLMINELWPYGQDRLFFLLVIEILWTFVRGSSHQVLVTLHHAAAFQWQMGQSAVVIYHQLRLSSFWHIFAWIFMQGWTRIMVTMAFKVQDTDVLWNAPKTPRFEAMVATPI